MIFYGYFRSSAAYRCRIAFNLLGQSPNERYVHLRDGAQKQAAFSQINPQKLVPALEIDGEVITQSLAIIEYLNERFEGSLLGQSVIDRAHIRAFAQILACDTHPLQNLRVLNYIGAEYVQDKSKWAAHWIAEGLGACEVIAERHEGPCVFGGTPSLADICLIPQLYNARRFGVDLSALPRLVAIESHCLGLDAFARAAPEVQPDAE